ncbi:hypothetical protein HUT03_03835 [Candidatus Liberibacter africanus]|uniref:Flagellar protein FlgJ N-terminal domain-containing protein n=1 Tax=Candidatus Liberibacter africanus PTSAPSY TaxID=1277257 RepID=A0A0G3I3F9_LIBAF|nr:hypothetical protein [Candidatus Liberibacter africanus]AKK20386.1 hypothetical protein G293_03800 [Candidatus Liberibacter africanus PTSAPSY]QTP64121.1 hypothetical protein HUT03_03835 [Candidatus Liberibacter africanus]
MHVSPYNSNTPYLQSMESNFSKVTQDDSFKSFTCVKNLKESSNKSKDVIEATQKLQGVLVQYFIKSILPEETTKSLGGGFNGDFWRDVFAENISNFIVKQQKMIFNLPEKSK